MPKTWDSSSTVTFASIGVDGIHSAVRQHFYKGEKAVFDGYLHYRGIV